MRHYCFALAFNSQACASDLVLRRREAASKDAPAGASLGAFWIILRDAMLRIALRMRAGIAAPCNRSSFGATLALALAIGAAPALAAEVKAGDIVIESPWARATPKGAEVGGGYLTIENNGAAPDRLTGGTADFAKVEIHEMKTANGVMTMRELKGGLAIPAHGSVRLAPGGIHLMFAHLTKPLVKGETVKATLTFEHAGSVPVEFPVEGLGASGPERGGAMGGRKM
jgi:periplasmic copper chaperone A